VRSARQSGQKAQTNSDKRAAVSSEIGAPVPSFAARLAKTRARLRDTLRDSARDLRRRGAPRAARHPSRGIGIAFSRRDLRSRGSIGGRVF
jgi:hypothetical protein